MTDTLTYGHCKTILQNGDHEPILQNDDKKLILQNGDSKPILQNGDSKTIFGSNDNKPILQNGDSETILQNGENETNLQNGNSETNLQNGNSETNLQSGNSVTNLQNGNSETILKNGNNETMLQKGNSETILQNGDSVTILQNGDSKPILPSGICEPVQQNGLGEELSNGFKNPTVPKPPRKKVSFHNNVTDIDDQLEMPLQYGDNPQDEEEEEKDDDEPKNFSLDDILNVSEKIKFFKTAFVDGSQTKGLKSHGHQSSIPEARLAFVTGMVESSLTGSNSRVEEEPVAESDGMQKDEEDTESKKNGGHVASVELTRGPVVPCPPQSETPPSNMAATQVTFMKIFAPQKGKNSMESVVDTSSILEHREELRELWEKRMMADDNQSSPSSIAPAEKAASKTATEEGHEEEVVTTKTISESETQPEQKLTNGVAKAVENNDGAKSIETNGVATTVESHASEDSANANIVKEEPTTAPAVAESAAAVVPEKVAETDHDNNNSPDSLEGNHVEEYVEEKTYTSELETSLVMKQVTDTTVETVAETSTTEAEKVTEEKDKNDEPLAKETAVTNAAEEVDGKLVEVAPEPTPPAVVPNEEQVSATESSHHEEVSVKETESHSSEEVIEHIEITTSPTKVEETHNKTEIVETVVDQKPILEIEESNQDGDGFVRLEECLPKVENTDVAESLEESSEQETSVAEQKPATTNGHAEPASVSPTPAAPTPEPSPEDKANHPEIEQFVKSGGVKRIIPGVQKTEQPYSTCTTETKIAMEIREMREREEELRLMREQAVLSPSASPVPPKSPSARSPSPSVKDGSSPTPIGCGYLVSSVFGHKGSTSPSPPVLAEEEKKLFKGLNKESAVEKEIRLARDREEELRKQKGLPPREDDSYVKPSQVKSSQVRVFGKMAGASNAVKQAATAKIQLEIEEQTQREMALRETGSIQTISHERTDAKVAKLKTPDTVSHPVTNGTNGNHTVSNGNYLNGNGRSSPDVAPYKRGSPSPTGPRPANIFSQSNGKGNISMHKFISSKGKETTFSAPRNGVPFVPKEEPVTRATVAAPVLKLKRNVSVESKIQQEILEMKQREEELKLLHMNKANGNHMDDNMEHEMNQKNNLMEYENGHDLNEEDISPRHNKLIAQWEQRIQKAES